MEGEKIKVDRLLNKEITVYDFVIKDSKLKPGTQCLYLQIEFAGERRVVFTGGAVLIEQIRQIDKDRFPFTVTIRKENNRLEFT